LKFDLVVAIFLNLIANDYKLHVVINGLVTFWLISISDRTITKPMKLICDLKIYVHGILYFITFIVLQNNVINISYSMLLRRPNMVEGC